MQMIYIEQRLQSSFTFPHRNCPSDSLRSSVFVTDKNFSGTAVLVDKTIDYYTEKVANDRFFCQRSIMMTTEKPMKSSSSSIQTL